MQVISHLRLYVKRDVFMRVLCDENELLMSYQTFCQVWKLSTVNISNGPFFRISVQSIWETLIRKNAQIIMTTSPRRSYSKRTFLTYIRLLLSVKESFEHLNSCIYFQDLSAQLEEIGKTSGKWSTWSDWSACSRSCDGGSAHQLRTCLSGLCSGEHVRYEICNMQVSAWVNFLIRVPNQCTSHERLAILLI